LTSYTSIATIQVRYLRRKKIYAIVKIAGRQYKVAPGQTIRVDLLSGGEGNSIEFDGVLLIADEDKIAVGKPTIDGARVTAVIGESGKGNKVIVGKFKAKNRYKKKSGHRQGYTNLTISEITPGSAS